MISNLLKQSATLVTATAVIAFVGFSVVEPAAVGAQSASDNVTVTLTVDEEISITDGANVSMTPNIGLSSDTSTGGSTWNVKTNSNAGYTLAVKATSSPAMQHQTTGASFADYSPSTANTPDSWSVDNGNYEFGYSVYGTDAESDFGSGTSCDGSGDPANTSNQYEGLATSDETVATRSTTTPSTGIDSTICFGAGQNGSFAPSGSYEATVIATATTN